MRPLFQVIVDINQGIEKLSKIQSSQNVICVLYFNLLSISVKEYRNKDRLIWLIYNMRSLLATIVDGIHELLNNQFLT